MVFCSPWVTSLYCGPVVGSVYVLCYCEILYLIKKRLATKSKFFRQWQNIHGENDFAINIVRQVKSQSLHCMLMGKLAGDFQGNQLLAKSS